MSLFYPEAAFTLLQGELEQFSRKADSGRTLTCFFCPDCGNRIYHDSSGEHPTIKIKPGTLDDTSWLQPMAHVWTSCKQPWVPIPEGVPTHETQP